MSEFICVCPACGYDGLREPPFAPWGDPSRETCPCCGIRFGFDDMYGVHAANRKAKHQQWRETWVAAGMPWRRPELRRPPDGWDPAAQLLNAARVAIPQYDCPVCGFDGLGKAPYYPDDWGGADEGVICPSCGTQFGYHDGAGGHDTTKRAARHALLRQEWIAKGMRWWRSEIYWWNVNVRFGGSPPPSWGGENQPPPVGWDPVAQLERLIQRAKSRERYEDVSQDQQDQDDR